MIGLKLELNRVKHGHIYLRCRLNNNNLYRKKFTKSANLINLLKICEIIAKL